MQQNYFHLKNKKRNSILKKLIVEMQINIWILYTHIDVNIQVVGDRQVTMHANGTEEVIHVVPYTTIRLRNTGTPIPFSSLKASYYGIELAS